jgi:predicted amidophosphoribosyltransferase
MVVTALVELLAPSRCLACRARGPMPWCAACDANVVRIGHGCQRCGGRSGRGHACWPTRAPVDATVALYDYAGPVAATIRTAKLGGAHGAWPLLGHALTERLLAAEVDVDVVTWVPTPAERARRRGYDHAALLGRAVASGLGLPGVALLHARTHLRGDVYRFRPPADLPGTRMLLVDDVLTTGQTAARAAGVLRAHGGDGIVLAVVARAGAHPLGA